MKNRDPIAEILAKNQRIGKGHKSDRFKAAFTRVRRINDAIPVMYDARDTAGGKELIKYVSIALCGCVEGYYRSVIRDLIDSGDPYRANAAAMDDLRLDVRTMVRMQSSRVSAGELISHLVPISSFEDVIRHLSKLTGFDYYERLKSFEYLQEHDLTLGSGFPKARHDLGRMFEDRHVYCHELATKAQASMDDAFDRTVLVTILIVADDSLMHVLMPERERRSPRPGR